jgi:competence protein ComEA
MSEPSRSCDPRPAASGSGAGRLVDLYHRIRTGEDPVAFGAVVLVVALVAGLAWYRAGLGGGGAEAAGALPRPADRSGPAVSASTTAPPPLVIHVAGAVLRPGLYRLPPGSRVADAVDAAGGAQPAADLDRLNLAGRVSDGQRVAVARRGQPDPPGPPGSASAAEVDTGTNAGAGPAEPIDLNTAGPAELQTLPGVGPAMARAILEERTRRGGFRSPRDLLGVPGIGERRFARLRDRVRV